MQSLAKWKRQALKDYGFRVGKGLYCDMNAIRRDEELDNLHSVYVDQWDWEKIITVEDRNETYLKNVVRCIVSAVCATEMNLHAMFPQLQELPLHTPNVTFVTTQELEDKYPDLTPKERENAFVKENGTTFLMKIGAPLRSGKPHDGRAPDYDDWDLNGDLLFWNDPLQCSYELSSMGIRVSPESMDKQLTMAGCDDRRALPFHKAVLAGELPYTIGGGIGQSRLCMLLLGSVHIGEVQASVWDKAPARPALRPASRCCKRNVFSAENIFGLNTAKPAGLAVFRFFFYKNQEGTACGLSLLLFYILLVLLFPAAHDTHAQCIGAGVHRNGAADLQKPYLTLCAGVLGAQGGAGLHPQTLALVAS